MTSTEPLLVQSDSIVIIPNSNKVLTIPMGWHGTVNFEDQGTISLSRIYPDSAELHILASKVWLVEFHDEFVKEQISNSAEYCSFDFNGYSFTVCKKEKGPITMFYQISRINVEEDGWTWFFRIVGEYALSESMKSDLKGIISQVVEISDPNNN